MMSLCLLLEKWRVRGSFLCFVERGYIGLARTEPEMGGPCGIVRGVRKCRCVICDVQD